MKIRVLLVDDDQAVLVTLARTLSVKRDIEVVGEALDGADAVDLAVAVPAEVIVMDERMPTMTGLEATRRIREAGITAPVLMFTADDGVEQRITDLTNVHYLSKGRGGFRAVPGAVRELAGSVAPGEKDRGGRG